MAEALHKLGGESLSDFIYGAEGLEALCFTTPALKTMFARYAKVVQMDGTYRTNRFGFALYHIVVTDKHGRARSVFYAFVRRETNESMLWVVGKFREIMGSATKEIRTVLLDKDSREIGAWRQVFPEPGISILLCTFHVLQAFRRKAISLYPSDMAGAAMRFFRRAVKTMSLSKHEEAMQALRIGFPLLWPYIENNWLNSGPMWAHFARVRLITYGDNTTNKTESLNRVLKGWCKSYMSITDCVEALATHLQSNNVDIERREAEEYCRRRQYNDRPVHVAAICQRLTAYASDIFLRHIDATSRVVRRSDWVDSCSCRFFSNWELPCVHIANCMVAKGVDPQLVLRGCRWLAPRGVSEMVISDENQYQAPSTSTFIADVLLEDAGPAFTEAYKYRQTMKLLDPLAEKLKSCGRSSFTKNYRILRECFERIMNGTSSDSDDHSSFNSSEREGVVDQGPTVVRCVMRQEGNLLCARSGNETDQPILVLHNDRLLPNFRRRGRPRVNRPTVTSAGRSHPDNTANYRAGGSTTGTPVVRRTNTRRLNGNVSDQENFP